MAVLRGHSGLVKGVTWDPVSKYLVSQVPVLFLLCQTEQGKILYIPVSSLLARSMRFTLHPLADMFIPTPTRLLLEESRQLWLLHESYSLIFPLLSLARYSFIQLSELGHSVENANAQSEITMEVGGCIQVSLGFCFFVEKSSQNSPKPVLIFWSSIPCVFCLYIHC